LKRGLVVAGHGRHYIVEAENGARVTCHPRGKKSECVVGDKVRWRAAQAAGEEGVIEAVEPRRNLLARKDPWKTKSFAANLDQLVLLVAVEPVFGESQLARALIAAEDAGIAARIVLNKIDLPGADAARARLASYRAMGSVVIELALKAAPGAARSALAERLHGRTTLVLGPSGSGKSTLVNLLVPDARVQVGEISRALRGGRHTTTTTRWYWLDPERSGALIDSPGFQEFGLRHIDAQALPRLMPDLREASTRCRFYNCTHRDEPGCGVREAVERGEISPSRWRIYQELFEEALRERS
jgi:ribosome biogenesis GTPase